MFTELNARLQEIAEALDARAVITSRLAELDAERVRAREAVAYCEAEAERGEQDLKALDGVAGLWSRLTGTYATRAEEEAKAVHAALVRLERARQVLAVAEQAYDDCEQVADHSSNLSSEFERLLAHKAMRLQQTDRPEKHELAALDLEISARMELLDEMAETLQRGQSALAALSAVMHKLDDARDLGMMDQAGMPLSGLSKQLRMRSAEELMRDADERYQRFFQHLGVIDAMVDRRTDLGLRDTAVADLAFDSFVTDIWVQGRIAEARRAVESRRDEVRVAVGRIADERGIAQRDLQSTEAEREKLLLEIR